ncbi:MAG: amidase domain-containing protein [Bacillota bacterium]
MQVILKKRMILLFIIILFIICGGLLHYFSSAVETVAKKQKPKDILAKKTQEIFALRNQTLLEQNKVQLKNLYNTEAKTGQWAYEHELKRMRYLQQWSSKQGAEFKEINSNVRLNSITEKEDYIVVNLSVSTTYQYIYPKQIGNYNTFRIGSYHSLKLLPIKNKLLIAREWYRDPFADSLDLDKIEKQKIVIKKSNSLKNLSSKRRKAIQYADQYCGAASPAKYGLKYNSKYKNYNYQGGDCANFASQILYEAGKFKKNNTWNYRKGAGSRAWVNAHALNQYMVYSNRASKIAYGSYAQVLNASYKLLPGDYIAYEKKGKVKHISIVTGVDSQGYRLVNCHNSDRYRVPWDLGWSDNEIKFWLVRVHYN